MNLKNNLLKNILKILGICLVFTATVLLILWQWSIYASERQAENYVNTINTLIPQAQGAVLQERQDNTMPCLSISGVDFVGIIELPQYNSVMPICNDWKNPAKYPCRFSGSLYDGTLQIGATSQKGQFDFYRKISVGDTLNFTDTEGNRYTYSVTDLKYSKNADKSTLQSKEAQLTIFIKNLYSFEYLIIYCNA